MSGTLSLSKQVHQKKLKPTELTMSIVRNNYPISNVKRSTNRRPSRRLNSSVSTPERSPHSVQYNRSPKKKKKKKVKSKIKKKNSQEPVSTRRTNPKMSQKKTKSADSFYSIPSESIEKHQLSSRGTSKKKKSSNFSKESSKKKKSSVRTIETVSSRGTQEPWSDGRFLEHLPSLYSGVDSPKETSTISVKSLFSDSSLRRGSLKKKSSPSPHFVSARQSSKRDSSKPLIRDSRKEPSKRDSSEALIRVSSKESIKRDSPKPLVRVSGKESAKRDSSKPLIRDSRKGPSERDSSEAPIRVSSKESFKRDSPKPLVRVSAKESTKRDSPKPLIRDSRKGPSKRDSSEAPIRVSSKESFKRESPKPLVRVSTKELSKRDSPKPQTRVSGRESYKRDTPKRLVRFSLTDISKRDSPKPLIRGSRKESSKRGSSETLIRVSSKESIKRDSPKALVRISTKEFSKRDSSKPLISDSIKKSSKRGSSKLLLIRGSSKKSSKRDSSKCVFPECPKASSKKCSSCIIETINKVFSKGCFPPTSCSLGNQRKKKMKIIFQDPRTEQETTIFIDDEDDSAPTSFCAPLFTSDCFKKRAPTTQQNVPTKLYHPTEMVDVYVNDPSIGNSFQRKKSSPGSSESNRASPITYPTESSSCQCNENKKLMEKTNVYRASFLTRYRTNSFKKIRQSKVNSSSNNSLHGHCRVCSILDRGLNLHNLHLLEQRNELMHSNKAGNSFLNRERSQVMESLYLQSMNDYVRENVFVEKRGKYIKRINEVRKSKKFIIPSDHLVESKKLESKHFTLLNKTTSSTSSEIVHLSQLRSTSIIATYSSGMLTQCSEQSAPIGPKLSKYNNENYKNKQIKNSIWNRLFKIFYQNKPFKTKKLGV